MFGSISPRVVWISPRMKSLSVLYSRYEGMSHQCGYSLPDICSLCGVYFQDKFVSERPPEPERQPLLSVSTPAVFFLTTKIHSSRMRIVPLTRSMIFLSGGGGPVPGVWWWWYCPGGGERWCQLLLGRPPPPVTMLPIPWCIWRHPPELDRQMPVKT